MSNETLKSIDAIIGRINTHKEYSERLTNEYLNALMREANKHSTVMEVEAGKSLGKKRLEQIARNALYSFRKARALLVSEGFQVSVFASLGQILEPAGHPYYGFRRDVRGVSHRAGDIEFPEAARVPYLVKNLVDFLNEELNVHPVLRAISAHLSFVSIHPYEDSNGRGARVIQNFALEQRRYPPAVIPADEREKYIQVLNPAVKSWLVHRSSYPMLHNDEVSFYDYVESKVLHAAQLLEKRLLEHRSFEVTFPYNWGYPHSDLRKSLPALQRRLSSRYGSNLIMHYEPKRNRSSSSLIISGNIGVQEIEGELKEHFSGKIPPKYHIIPLIDFRKQ